MPVGSVQSDREFLGATLGRWIGSGLDLAIADQLDEIFGRSLLRLKVFGEDADRRADQETCLHRDDTENKGQNSFRQTVSVPDKIGHWDQDEDQRKACIDFEKTSQQQSADAARENEPQHSALLVILGGAGVTPQRRQA